jgi:thiamine biosynthesis lipoprotein
MLKQFFQTQQALGSNASIVLVANQHQPLDELFDQLWKQVFMFERQFSRFLPSSELSVFNRNAGTKQFITPEFSRLLQASKNMAELSSGLYNPFILPALQRAGYKKSALPGYENDPVDDHSHKSVTSIDKLELGSDWARIPYGTAIDMGGCGKGYLADQVADLLDSKNLDGYWVSLGGDMVVSGTDDKQQPWKVDIQSANPDQKKLPIFVQTDGQRLSIATSGTFRRQNQPNLKHGHHIIDPKTLKPAITDISLATVVDSSAIRSDVLASCAVLKGSAAALPYLRAHHVGGAVIQSTGKHNVKLQSFGSNVQKFSGVVGKERQHA